MHPSLPGEVATVAHLFTVTTTPACLGRSAAICSAHRSSCVQHWVAWLLGSWEGVRWCFLISCSQPYLHKACAGDTTPTCLQGSWPPTRT